MNASFSFHEHRVIVRIDDAFMGAYESMNDAERALNAYRGR